MPMMSTHFLGPLLHLYLVSVEDADAYRQSSKKQIQEWLSSINQRKNQEWLIVYVTSGEASTKTSTAAKFLSMKSSMYDKLKVDFNIKKDRVAQLQRNVASSKDAADSWNELLLKMTDGILTCFNSMLLQADEDVKRIESQSNLPGWNYCQLFVMKEGLAFSYELINVIDEALNIYDELERSFYDNLATQGLQFFKDFGGRTPGDDSVDPLTIKRKPYREMILANDITIFDFRMYLFGRQCLLTMKLNRPTEACERARSFVVSFSRTLKDYDAALVPHFRISWAFTCCQSVVTQCEELVAVNKFSPQTVREYEAAKAELLHVARLQLDKIGLLCGFLAPSVLSTPSEEQRKLSENSPARVDELDSVTNVELRGAMANVDGFDSLYIKLCQRAARSLEISGRYRTMFLVKGDSALLHFHRARYAIAGELLENMCTRYSATGWSVIEASLLEKLAVCQKETKQYAKYLMSCLSLMELGTIKMLGKERIEFYQMEAITYSEVMEEEITSTLNEDSDDVLFKIAVTSFTENVGDDDGSTAEVVVVSALPRDFPIHSISMSMTSSNQDPMLFTCGATTIQPGANKISVQCDRVPLPGEFVVNQVLLRLGKLTFLSDFAKHPTPTTFVLEESPMYLWTIVGLPDTGTFDDTPTDILVRIYTRRNDVNSGTLQMSFQPIGAVGRVNQVAARISAETDPEAATEVMLDVTDGVISLPECGELQVIDITVPFEATEMLPQDIELSVKSTVIYVVPDGRRRVQAFKDSLQLAQPMDVVRNTLVYEDGAFVDVTITNVNVMPIRITSALFEGLGDNCEQFGLPNPNTTLQCGQTLRLACQVPADADVRSNGLDGTVKIQYHFVHEEIEAFLIRTLDNLLSAHSCQRYSGYFAAFAIRCVLNRVDYDAYAASDVVTFPPWDPEECARDLRGEPEGAGERAVKVAEELLQICSTTSRASIFKAIRLRHKTLTTKVQVRFSKLTVSVHLEPPTIPASLGVPLPCQLEVRVLHHPEGAPPVSLAYEVAETQEWAVDGWRRKTVTVEPTKPFSTQISLIPLVPGRLSLPRVSVRGWEGGEVDVVRPSAGVQVRVGPGRGGVWGGKEE
ncbi:hypothetical protein M427DRAFT_110316 [Gonapodya prolifera JEL478]|uniref:Trafficking protein particle complex subunit 11 domain-containing protein n=1 Tax=Gonapodya prolifera (strain JEL478) TaxID=1344416 RepID=A0A139ALH3_GONPJ|nr:hypothetical protein M427DRAFT_110316 [Gonapodya prolifera JEL478]|eukprot:KXS17548.1 hypothetical protein M427DRAFT_110316 [Gonapodya prolifera JEL478]